MIGHKRFVFAEHVTNVKSCTHQIAHSTARELEHSNSTTNCVENQVFLFKYVECASYRVSINISLQRLAAFFALVLSLSSKGALRLELVNALISMLMLK